MNLRFQSHDYISDKDRELLDIINLPEVQPYFMIPQIKGLKSDVEDMHLLCVHKYNKTKDYYKKNDNGLFIKSSNYDGSKLREIIHIDIDEMGSESSASASININSVNKVCPKDDWHRIWFHTHNHSISAQSTDDRFATQTIYSNGMGDVMCATGINGVSCHFPRSNPPAIAKSRWDDSFWNLLKVKDINLNLLLPLNNMNEDLILETKKEIKTDQIICNNSLHNNSIQFNCTGRNWEKGLKEFPIGIFNSIYFDGPTDNYGSMIISIPQDNKYECFSIKTESSGRKLICK